MRVLFSNFVVGGESVRVFFWSFGSWCVIWVICVMLRFRRRFGPGCYFFESEVVRVFAFGDAYVL